MGLRVRDRLSSKQRVVANRDHRGADTLPDWLDSVEVRRTHPRVVFVRVCEGRERSWESDLGEGIGEGIGEGLGDDRIDVLALAGINACTEHLEIAQRGHLVKPAACHASSQTGGVEPEVGGDRGHADFGHVSGNRVLSEGIPIWVWIHRPGRRTLK